MLQMEEREKTEPRKMLNIDEVLEIVPVGKSTLFRMVKEGTFPKGKLISPNRRVWDAAIIARWQNELPADRVTKRRRTKPSG